MAKNTVFNGHYYDNHVSTASICISLDLIIGLVLFLQIIHSICPLVYVFSPDKLMYISNVDTQNYPLCRL